MPLEPLPALDGQLRGSSGFPLPMLHEFSVHVKTCIQVRTCTAILQERYSRKTEAADLQRAFTILDSKGDGKIDAAELGSLFRRLGHKLTKVVQHCQLGDL